MPSSRLAVFCYVDVHVICQRMRWQVYLQAEMKRKAMLMFSHHIPEGGAHSSHGFIKHDWPFFSSFTVASDGFICASHLVLRSIINLFHTHLGRKSYLMFYFTVSWGFPSDLGFLCSARHLCVSLALSVSALSVRLFREGATVDVVLLFVMWECGGDFIFAWRRGETLFVDSDFWFILPVFLNLTKS